MKKDKFFGEIGRIISEVHENGLNPTAFLQKAFEMYKMTKGARMPKGDSKEDMLSAIHWAKRKEFLQFLEHEFDRCKMS